MECVEGINHAERHLVERERERERERDAELR